MFISVVDGISGNGAKAYKCRSCGGPVTFSDRLKRIVGAHRHLFVNPAGLECDFHTFYACPGAMALGDPVEAHTWFPGYTWRMAFCRQCGQHLGWYYEAVLSHQRPWDFWGILVSHVINE